MTYRQLLKVLQEAEDARLDDDVTIYDASEDEFFAVESVNVQLEDDVLDEGHIYLSYRPWTE